MKPGTYILVIFSICVYAVISCKPQSNNNIVGGGKGGNVTLNIIPRHHDTLIDSCVIYIKYGTNDAPANGIYDDSTSCVLIGDLPTATFHSLTKGLYYIYGHGYHPTDAPPYVIGGVPVIISSSIADTLLCNLPTYGYWH